MKEILSQYGIYILVFGGIMIFSFIITKMNNKRLKNSADDFFAKHPEAAKVFCSSKTSITQEELHVINIDGEVPVAFREDGKDALYVLPGERTLLLCYTYTRPGVMHKTVSKSTGNVEQTVTIEPNKSYLLGYNKKSAEFTFEEI